MDREGILRELFPQVDARLIKAALLDGDDMESAVDFLIEEGMKYDQMANFDGVGTKVDFERENNQGRDDFAKVRGALNDSCYDKHEEEIVWMGIYQTQLNNALAFDTDDDDDSNSSVQSDHDNANSIQTQTMDAATSQIPKFSGDCKTSTYPVQRECGSPIPIPIIHTVDNVLTEFNTDHKSKDNVHISEGKMQSQGYPLSHRMTYVKTAPVEVNEPPEDVFDSDDHKDFCMRESSLQEIQISDLDKLIEEAKCCKENMRQETEGLYALRVTTECEESAAQVAKMDALNADSEILGKVEDLQNQLATEKAKFEMHAVEIYGEKSVLSMEAREIKVRLEKTRAEQMKALEAINDVRHVLMSRLKTAAEEKNSAMEECTRKVRNAQERLAMEEASIEKVAQEYQALEAEAEMCKRLRDLLVERGSLVDSLQGEMAVLSEDIFAFKKQVDEGIPLSSSRYSTISSLSSKYCGSEGPVFLKSVSSGASPVSSIIGSSASDLPESIPPIECTLQSQYFSPTNSVIEVRDNKALLKKPCSQMIEGNQNEDVMQETRTNAINDVSQGQLDDEDWDVLGSNRN